MNPADPEVAAISAVCAALAGLESEAARQRVLDYAAAKFSLTTGKRAEKSTSSPDEVDTSSDLFSQFDNGKPHENVWLVTAEHYSKSGIQPFTVGDIKARAEEVGLVIPARIDKTLEGSTKGGKAYYQKVGPGRYRVTVHGEAFLRETYGVKKPRSQPFSQQQAEK